MTSLEYRDALAKLGLTIVGAAPYFSFGRRHSQRIAGGRTPVPGLVEKVLCLLLSGKITKEDLL